VIRTAIIFVIANYTLSFLVVGLIASGIAIALAPQPIVRAVIVDKLLAWYLFFNIGIMYLVNFIFHVFFGAMAAAFIGWSDSPFQFEVGTASLGFSIAASLPPSAYSIADSSQ
jgi:hypothetical protein